MLKQVSYIKYNRKMIAINRNYCIFIYICDLLRMLFVLVHARIVLCKICHSDEVKGQPEQWRSQMFAMRKGGVDLVLVQKEVGGWNADMFLESFTRFHTFYWLFAMFFLKMNPQESFPKINWILNLCSCITWVIYHFFWTGFRLSPSYVRFFRIPHRFFLYFSGVLV